MSNLLYYLYDGDERNLCFQSNFKLFYAMFYFIESHRKEYDVLRNLNLKPKLKLSKSSTSVEDIKVILNFK